MPIPRWSSAGATTRVVLSRVDGTLEITDIAALAGVPEDEVERALEPLLASGAVTMEGARTASSPSLPPPMRRSSSDLASEALTKISDEDNHRISDLYARLVTIDHYRLLGVSATADVKEIKRAYYAQAKLHHPDRFFRKDVGALRPKIEAIFAALTTALETLVDPERRATYDAYLREVLKSRLARRNAEQLERVKDWAGAASLWNRVAEQLPLDAYVLHRNAAALLRARTDLEAAIALAARATELDAKRPEYRLTLASLYLAIGRDGSALTELEAALDLDPSRNDVAELLAAIGERVASARGQSDLPRQ